MICLPRFAACAAIAILLIALGQLALQRPVVAGLKPDRGTISLVETTASPDDMGWQ